MLEIKDFADRREGERVEFFVRSSPLYLFWRLLPPLLLTGIGFVLAVAIPGLVGVESVWTVLVTFFLLGLPLLWLAWRFSLWYYDYFIITNIRILDFLRKPFIYEQRNEAMLNRIQDVRVVFPNSLTVSLNIGHVYVQTAGMAGQLSFRYATHPNQVQARLLHLVAQAQSPKAGTGPLGQLVSAMRQTVEPSAPGAGAGGLAPTPGPGDGQTGLPPARRRTMLDLFLYSPVSGTNQITWRKHWWILVKAIFLPTVLMGLILALLVLVSNQTAVLIAAVLFFADLLWLTWRTMDWYNDVYIITDDRIVDIEKVPLISEDRREARLTMIQDVNYLQPNFTARLLGFGDVIVETAAKSGAFTFNSVPNPREVQREIFARWERTRQPQNGASAQQAQEFVNWLDRYHDMKHG
jgi:Bacterial PH domain